MALVNGTNRDDTLYGTGAGDTINGGFGNDTLKGGGGADRLDGGDGIDTAFYDDSPVGVVVSLAGVTGRGGTAEGDTLANVEFVYGSAFNDILIGDGGINQLNGLSGDDILDGGAETDYLNGGDGKDTLKGGGGADVLFGGDGDDMLDGGAGADNLVGGAGFDTVTYVHSAAGVFVSLITNTAAYGDAEGDRLEIIDGLIGSSQADNLWGHDAVNTLQGLDGNDTLKGFGGSDSLDGGDGNDSLFGMEGHDTLDGGDGADTLDGGSGGDSLSGGFGADTLRGGADSDSYFVDSSADVVIEARHEGSFDTVFTSTAYALATGSEVERLRTDNVVGTTRIDLAGNEFGNTIAGNNGQNVIVGYGGLDIMTGNGLADVFVWTSTAETGIVANEADVVTDFNPGVGDSLAFNLIDADVTVGGDQAFTFIGTADFTAPGQIRTFTDGLDTFILLNTDTDAVQEATIRVLGVHTVDAGWFVL
jgi:Ca2+-binding RTX toxin-like protein